jgi:hypothetical protein
MPGTLTFDEAKHLYLLDGVRLPNVTGILESMGASPQYPAGPYRERGKRVHAACDLYDAGVLDQWEVGETIQGYVESYRKLFLNFPFQWNLIERPMYDPELLVAGKVDRGGTIWGEECVADLKSGKPGKEVRLQLAAYARMVYPKTYRSVKRFKIELDAQGAMPIVREFTDPIDLTGWVGMVNYYKWQRMAA